MNEAELREMDMKVHLALYPEQRIERRERKYGIDYRAITPGDGPNTWVKDIPLPWYTTDIQDWEPIYALKPEWSWNMLENDGAYVEAHLFIAPGGLMGDSRMVASGRVYPDEARGLAAYALGRARCVIAWKEAQK